MNETTFENARRRAYGMLDDVVAELRSDYLAGAGPTRAQAKATSEAKVLVAKAMDALERAAR